jgi:hypothetical protein
MICKNSIKGLPMNVTSKMQNNYQNTASNEIRTNFTEKISKEEVQEIKAKIAENSKAIVLNESAMQSKLQGSESGFEQEYQNFQNFLKDVGYTGKPIAKLSKEEASELVSEDGLFGIKQTSERIANFVINGSAGNEEMMRAGREGMLRGFKEAESMWGGELPEISQKTMQAAVEMVDKAMMDLGFSLIDTEA